MVADVGLEPVSFFRVVVCDEGDARAHDAGAGLHGVAGDVVHRVWIVKGVFRHRSHGVHGGLNLPHADVDGSLCILQRELRPPFRGMERLAPDVEVVGDTDQRQHEDGDEYLQKFLLRELVVAFRVGHGGVLKRCRKGT